MKDFSTCRSYRDTTADTLDMPNATVTRLIQRLQAELKVRLPRRT